MCNGLKETFQQLSKRTIYPAKFGQNPAGSLGVSFEEIVADEQQMTNKGHPTITKAHLVPIAQVS